MSTNIDSGESLPSIYLMLRGIPHLDDLSALAASKSLVKNYTKSPQTGSQVLTEICQKCPSALFRTVSGQWLACLILEQVLKCAESDPSSMIHSLQTLGHACLHFLSSKDVVQRFWKQCVDFLKLFRQQGAVIALDSLFFALMSVFKEEPQLPFSLRQEICSIAKISKLSAITIREGIEFGGPLWTPVISSWLMNTNWITPSDKDLPDVFIQIILSVSADKIVFGHELNLPNTVFESQLTDLTWILLSQFLQMGEVETLSTRQMSVLMKDPELFDKIEPLVLSTDSKATFGDLTRKACTLEDIEIGTARSLLQFLTSTTPKTCLARLCRLKVSMSNFLLSIEADVEDIHHMDALESMPQNWTWMLSEMVQTPYFLENSGVRTVCCELLTTLFALWSPPFALSHEHTLASWCIGCLCSTNRRVRLAALRLYLRFSVPTSEPASVPPSLAPRQASRLQSTATRASSSSKTSLSFTSLKFIKSLATKESSIVALANAAVSSKGAEQSYCLLQLMESLASPLMFQRALAFQKLKWVAISLGLTSWQLFGLYISPMSNAVVLQLDEKPLLLPTLCKLLDIKEQEFLMRTSACTVPYLVLGRKSSYLKRVADARVTSTIQLALYFAGPILATLLTHTSSNPLSFAQARWFEVYKTLARVEFKKYLSTYAEDIIFELLKSAPGQNEDDPHEKRIIHAITLILDLDQTDSQKLKDKALLRLVQLFSDMVRSPRPDATKDMCLKGLELLFRSCDADFWLVQDQVLTLIQSTVVDDQLETAALSALSSLFKKIGPRATSSLNVSLSLIAEIWPVNFKAQAVIEDLLASLGRIPEIVEYVEEHGAPALPEDLLPVFSPPETDQIPLGKLKRIAGRGNLDNQFVAQNVIKELISYVEKRELILDPFDQQRSTDLLNLVLTNVFGIASRFKDNDEISAMCAKFLGLLGAQDPHQVAILPRPKPPVVTSNFENREESILFVVSFIETYLLKELEASTDPKFSTRVAYGLQEFLKFSGLTANTPDKLWLELFSESAVFSLQLYTRTRFTLTTPPIKNRIYPIFNGTIRFADWLFEFSDSMMQQVDGINVNTIFTICRRVLRGHAEQTEITSFLLPYAALNAIISDQEALNNLYLEVKEIINRASTEKDDLTAFHNCIFTMLEYFGAWIRMKEDQGQGGNDEVILIKKLLHSVSLSVMGDRAFEGHSYERGIRYLEQLVRDRGLNTKDTGILSKISTMYSKIGDTDGFEGIMTKILKPSLQQQIKQQETNSNWNSALALFGVHRKSLTEWSVDDHREALECLMKTGQHASLLTEVEHLVSSNTAAADSLEIVSLAVEAAWRTFDWASLTKWVNRAKLTGDTPTTVIGRAILSLRSKNLNKFHSCMEHSRHIASKLLSQNEITDLSQVATLLSQLHALGDLESIATCAFEESDISYKSVKTILDHRLSGVGPSYESKDFILSVRRAAFENATSIPFANSEVARTFLIAASESRKQKMWDRSLANILTAQQLGEGLASTEQARLLWDQGEARQATRLLAAGLDDGFLYNYRDARKNSQSFLKKGEKCEIALLYTEWLEISGQALTDEIVARYQAIQHADTKSAEATYRLMKHYLKIYDTQANIPSTDRAQMFLDGTLLEKIISLQARVLSLGVTYVRETLPKMITLWLDYGVNVHTNKIRYEPLARTLDSSYLAQQQKNNLIEICANLKNSLRSIPAYSLYTGLAQILSRITHPQGDVYNVMRSLITTVTVIYPEQALWSVLELTNKTLSDNEKIQTAHNDRAVRKSRGEEILSLLTSKNKEWRGESISKAQLFISNLTMLCYFKPEKTAAKIRIDSLKLPGLSSNILPIRMAVPVQKTMVAVMPRPNTTLKSHRAFPNVVTIYKIANEARVLQSLQKPKRLDVTGSDGLHYNILAKGQDDVRKDARLVDFTTTVNSLLAETSDEAKIRHLNIANYHVTPLEATSGLIEWVDDAKPMRRIIEEFLSSRNRPLELGSVRVKISATHSEASKITLFHNLMLEYPPALGEWFLRTFPDPAAWLSARRRFARGAAVMSMVGYILGLGDRHLENLLILQNSGALLHVDFDCLFDKGQRFQVPEIVPFRLTQNILDAFGVSGYEGTFRKACEITLQMIRDHEDMLMTVLEPFVHDPVAGFEASSKSLSSKAALNKIRDKIRGTMVKDSVPLSVNGQVEKLIQEAVSPSSLSKMYVGWTPFL